MVKKLAIGLMSLLMAATPLNSSNYDIKTATQKEYRITDSKRDEFVKNAKRYLNTPWEYNGRMTEKNPDIDCLGLLFLAYSKTFHVDWTKFSYYPSIIVKKEQLGKPVKGLDGVLTKDLDISKLEKGDIIYLLSTNEINDKPLANIEGVDYWPWHTGIYSDKEKNLFLEAHPGTVVLERDFNEVLHGDDITKGIFVTRFSD